MPKSGNVPCGHFLGWCPAQGIKNKEHQVAMFREIRRIIMPNEQRQSEIRQWNSAVVAQTQQRCEPEGNHKQSQSEETDKQKGAQWHQPKERRQMMLKPKSNATIQQ